MQQLTHLNNTSSIRNKNSDNRYRTRYRDYNKMIVYYIVRMINVRRFPSLFQFVYQYVLNCMCVYL